jgi:hypothetical protein
MFSMAIERIIIPDTPPHATAGGYVETFARHHIYGRSGCFACPELGLFGYMALNGMRLAILRVSGVPGVRNMLSYRPIASDVEAPRGSADPAGPS